MILDYGIEQTVKLSGESIFEGANGSPLPSGTRTIRYIQPQVHTLC